MNSFKNFLGNFLSKILSTKLSPDDDLRSKLAENNKKIYITWKAYSCISSSHVYTCSNAVFRVRILFSRRQCLTWTLGRALMKASKLCSSWSRLGRKSQSLLNVRRVFRKWYNVSPASCHRVASTCRANNSFFFFCRLQVTFQWLLHKTRSLQWCW